MKIALYRSQECLPSGEASEQPEVIFDPGSMKNFLLFQENGAQPQISAKSHWVWRMLMGLHRIRSKEALGHMSVYFKDGLFYLNQADEHVMVEVTTISPVLNHDMPFVSDGRGVIVRRLWQMYWPLNRIEQANEMNWEEYFRLALRSVREQLLESIRRDTEKARALKGI